MTQQHSFNTRRWLSVGAVTISILFFLLMQMQSASASPDQNVYIDSLTSGWQNWSWDSTLNFSSTSTVKSGANALSAEFTAGWAGTYLRGSSPMSTSGLNTLRFWLHGGSSGNQSILVKTVNGSEVWSGDYFITASPNQWVLYEIPLANLGNPTSLLGLVFQNPNNSAQPVFYLDGIAIVDNGSPTTTPAPTTVPGSGPTLTINANEGRHPISPEIYGMNFPDTTLAKELQLPVARWGGNATTRYNWQLDVSNRAHDWYYENIANDVANLSALPYGSSSDRFVADNQQANSETLMTIPMIGWTPKSRNKDCGYSVSKYGNQQSTDPWAPDCGNGMSSNGSKLSGNNPADTSMAVDEAYVQAWMEHLISQYGTANQGGVRFYNLDNEPMLWSETHHDVHSTPVSYDELRDLTYRYAAAIKATDPGAQTLGPVVWGWSAYFHSAADGDWWLGAPDRNAHGGTPFLPWYLDQMKQYERSHGVRILDYLDVHYYPQQSGVALQQAGNSATQELRLRSTRALWDSSYVDESWINEPVYLIPRMQEWIDSYYPGTKLAITEYNWGGLEHMNGALTQADVLGIFGREGVDLATIWDPPAANQPGAYAFRMYLNYDGNNGRFGDTSIYANSNDTSKVAIYGSVRSSDGALLLMVINKSKNAITSPVALNNFSSNGQAEVYRYSNANLNAIVHDGSISVSGNTFNAYLPAESMTLYVLPMGTAVPPTATNTPAPTATNTPVATATNTPVPTATNTPAPTATAQPTVAAAKIHIGNLTATSVLNGGSRWTATVTALIVTENGQPVSGATVTGSWSNGAKGSDSCTTDTNGRCDLTKTGIRTRTGSVKLTVTNVAHAQYPYDKAANGMTSITVNVPNFMDQ